jgi:hypothetical protein
VKTSAAAERYAPRDYNVEVISDPPGAAIEVNGDYRGRAPCDVKIKGTGNRKIPLLQTTVVKAIPSRPGDFVQTKYFYDRDDVPRRLFFKMDLGPATPQVDVNVNQ